MACECCVNGPSLLTDVSVTLPDNNQEVIARLRLDNRGDEGNSLDVQLTSYYHKKTNGEIGDVSEWSHGVICNVCPYCGQIFANDGKTENSECYDVVISFNGYLGPRKTYPVMRMDKETAVKFIKEKYEASGECEMSEFLKHLNISGNSHAIKNIILQLL